MGQGGGSGKKKKGKPVLCMGSHNDKGAKAGVFGRRKALVQPDWEGGGGRGAGIITGGGKKRGESSIEGLELNRREGSGRS